MAAFKDWQELSSQLDGQILMNGSISLYYKLEILNQTIAWLSDNKYLIYTLDCSKWSSTEDFQKDISNILGFPKHFGKTLDGFNDCLSDIEISDEGGAGIVFLSYDCFQKNFSEYSQKVLDILDSNSRGFMLFGKRLITLVQSNDPRIYFS